MNYMHYLDHMPQQLVQHMTLTSRNVPTILAWVLCMTFGYLLYTQAIRMILRERADPYPLWVHCWMITIDTIGSFTFWKLAIEPHFFWLFVVMGIGLPIWVILEASCIVFAVRHTREEDFKGTTKDPITLKQASINAIGMILVAFSVNMWALSMLGGTRNGAIFLIYPFTNYVFAYWTWRTWESRGTTGTRVGNSMGLQVVITIQITLMWVPGLSWYLSVTPFFNEPWYYVCGIVASLLAAYNCYRLSRLPKKEPQASGKKVVW